MIIEADHRSPCLFQRESFSWLQGQILVCIIQGIVFVGPHFQLSFLSQVVQLLLQVLKLHVEFEQGIAIEFQREALLRLKIRVWVSELA